MKCCFKKKGKKTKFILPGGTNILPELLLPSASIVSSGVGVGVWLEDDAPNINDCKQKQPRNRSISSLVTPSVRHTVMKSSFTEQTPVAQSQHQKSCLLRFGNPRVAPNSPFHG